MVEAAARLYDDFATACGMAGSSPGNFASQARRSARSLSTRAPYSAGV